MLQWWDRFSKLREVAHVLRAVERFNTRNGNHLSAAIAYFSVLSLVPILMLVFSGVALAYSVFLPEQLRAALTWLEDQFAGESALGVAIRTQIESWLGNWTSTLLFALAIGFWSGSSWVGNLKRAVRLLMRSEVDKPGRQLFLPLDLLANFAGLVALFVGVIATFAAINVATTAADLIGAALHISADGQGWVLLLRLIILVIAFAAGTGMFWLLFAWFAPEPVPGAHRWIGSAVGAAGLVILAWGSGYLISIFSRNLGASVFGSTIVVMLFLNLFATLILYIAAWLATDSPPVLEVELAPEPEPEPVEAKPGQLYVSAKVAEKSLGIGLKTGYVAGAATGLGLGALLVGGLRSLFGKSRP